MKVLGRRELNRALLARQLLLRRSPMAPLAAVEHLVGMQAQAPNSPYYGLWTRLATFEPGALCELITGRDAVRIGLMRGTLHLVSARDAITLRPVMQQVVDRAALRGLDGPQVKEVQRAARELLERLPMTTAELAEALTRRWPECDLHALRYAVRYALPLVQVPPRGLWRTRGLAAHTTVEHWLGRPLATRTEPDEAVLRYLAAFGPASVRDACTWSGLAALGPVFERLRPRLCSFRDERGVELFDLPDAPRPGADAPAPVRFLADFDNIVLSHADRSRIVAGEHRGRIMTGNAIGRPSVLVDGFVAGTWKIDKRRLVVRPFAALAPAARAELEEEGARLLAFALGPAGPPAAGPASVELLEPG